MKKSDLKRSAPMLIAFIIVVSFGVCTCEYETTTDEAGNYKYSMGKQVNIKDITSNEIITACRGFSFLIMSSDYNNALYEVALKSVFFDWVNIYEDINYN